MIDFLIIFVALLIYRLGTGHRLVRLLLLAGLVGSSAFAITVIDVFDVIQKIDPLYFYSKSLFAIGLCGLAIYHRVRHIRVVGLTFLAISAVNFMCFREFYLEASFFYDIYSELMIALTAWQVWLLIRIGDVDGNFTRKYRSYRRDRVPANNDMLGRRTTL